MEDTLMNKEEIINYVWEKLNFFKNKEDLTCEEIGDGNINYVFKIVEEKTGKSLVVKKSHELLRSSGRPLDLKRSAIEARSLQIKNALVNGACPEIYLYDQENSLIVMEDISDYKNLRKELMEERVYENFPEDISDFLAKSLLPTTDLVLARKDKKQKVIDFTNPDMCDISEDLVFTEPYYDYKNRNNVSPGLEDFVRENLYENMDLQKEVLILKDKFQNQSQALVHGDLHSGSIFVNEKGIKIIDSEFAFYGPIGYDYGNIWGNLVFPLARAYVLGKDSTYIEKLRWLLAETIDKSIKKTYLAYDKFVSFPYFKNQSFKNTYIENIISDSFGYGGCEIIRRTVGDSSVLEIESVKDIKTRQILDKVLIKTGIFMLMNKKKIQAGQELLSAFDHILEGYKDEI